LRPAHPPLRRGAPAVGPRDRRRAHRGGRSAPHPGLRAWRRVAAAPDRRSAGTGPRPTRDPGAPGMTAHGPLALPAAGLADRPAQLLVLLGALSLLPLALVLLTSFLKMVVVLSVTRSALGAPQVPP